MTQPTAGGLGGYLGSRGFGNILQAAGMSLMSSPRNNPLAGFAQAYTGIQDQQMKLDERDQSRASLAAVLKAAGFNDEQAAILSTDPNAVRAALEQKKLQDEKAAADSFYARMPPFGGLGGLGGQPDATQLAAGGLLSFPGVSDAQAPEIERTPLPAPTQTQFGLRGAAQLDPHNLNVGQIPPDDRVLEPVVNIPQESAPAASGSGNQTMAWLEKNHPEVAALVTPDSGITPRDAFEIARVRQKTMSDLPQDMRLAQYPIPSGTVQGKSPPGLPATAQHGAVMRGGDGKTYQYIQLSGGPGGDGEWGWGEVNFDGPDGQEPGQTSGNRTLDYLKKHAPDVAALTEGPDGIPVRDAYSIHVEDRKLRQAADETQAKLDQLYRYRDQYAQWASTARSDKTYNVAKRGLDGIDTQIARLERQQTRLAPPDGFRALEMRAEAAGLQPGTPEYQKFMASGGREGSLVTINNSPEGDVFAGMPKDIREEMFKRQGEAQDAADLIGITNQGLQLLDQGAITGAGSGAKVAAVKWAQSVGVPIDGDIADAVNNAETYRAVMAQAVGKVIKNFGSGTGLSDADRQYAERLAGGDTTLNEPAIRRILAAGVKSAKSKIGNFNGMRDKVLSGDLSAILNVQEPPEYSAPTAGGGTRARNPQTGETLEWDGSQWRQVQ
ncbi:MAG: hypothetical protein WA975_19670 [Mesorhizobium sp.]